MYVLWFELLWFELLCFIASFLSAKSQTLYGIDASVRVEHLVESNRINRTIRTIRRYCPSTAVKINADARTCADDITPFVMQKESLLLV
jgi:hypothetical protein